MMLASSVHDTQHGWRGVKLSLMYSRNLAFWKEIELLEESFMSPGCSLQQPVNRSELVSSFDLNVALQIRCV